MIESTEATDSGSRARRKRQNRSLTKGDGACLGHHQEFVADLVSRGGPETNEYADLDAWIAEIHEMRQVGKLDSSDLSKLIQTFGGAFSPETMQGFAFQKPHGYAGDFEIIDRIYRRYLASSPDLRKWDVYWQGHAAAEAVRNRVGYFVSQVEQHRSQIPTDEKFRVLNLASGPCRDVWELFESHDALDVCIECVEQDEKAIQHGRSLCADYLDRIRFHQRNALRFRSKDPYDLIWSAGLFDYFDDSVFVFMLRKLESMLELGGRIVVGNFSTMNPSRPYMELFDWTLHHRSPQTLKYLAREAGFSEDRIYVDREPLGVNLFLHLQK